MRLIQVSLLVLIVVLQYRFWFGENGYLDKQRLEIELQEELTRLEELQDRNDNLLARVRDLKTGNDAVEELARQNLGLIKPGEVFIIITDELN